MNREILLSVKDIKKWFPVDDRLFGKPTSYVKAVDVTKAANLFIIETHQSVDDTLSVLDKAFVGVWIHTTGKQSADSLRAAFGIDRSPAAKAAVCFLLF